MSLIPDPDVRLGPFATTDTLNGTQLIPLETTDGDVVDLDGWTALSAAAISPAGSEEILEAEIVELVDGSNVLEVTLPAVSVDEPGVWQIVAVLADPAGSQLETEALRFVAEDRASGWLTLAGIRQLWTSAPRSDVALFRLLEVAKTQIVAYAPEPLPTIIPAPWLNVQRDYVRDVWNVAKRDQGTFEVGDSAFAVQLPTLSPALKDQIRPKRVKPVVA